MRIISEIRNGHAWTRDDEALLADLPQEEQEIILDWISQNIIPRKTPCEGHTSYGIKHYLEDDTKIYTTNNQFKDAMLLSGYEPVDDHLLNWTYRISKKSPAFDYKKRGYIC